MEGDIVKCGTAKPTEGEDIYALLMANKVEGKETITFAKVEWEKLAIFVDEMQKRLYEISLLTPVKGAHGLCKVTTCQWEELSTIRDRANINSLKITKLYTLIDGCLSFVDRLVEEKLIAAEGWWIRKLSEARRELEDLKRT